jgi:hypothetical protein
VHDFPDPEMGKAIPYGVYDVGGNEGWVNVGDHHDPPAFAVASIARWWQRMGRARYPDATRLMITADAGGSNGYRSCQRSSNSLAGRRSVHVIPYLGVQVIP